MGAEVQHQHLPEQPTLEQVQDFFKHDRFATVATGCKVIAAEKGRAVCELEIQDVHRNQMDNVMGGAIFTLADFALAVSVNVGQPPTVSVNHSIDFMRATKGTKLTATATCEKAGRSLVFMRVDVVDDLGKDIARMNAVCSRVG